MSPTRVSLILAALFLALTSTSCVTVKRIDTGVQIAATPEEVYAVLADFERYPDWNPYHIRVVGEPTVGSKLEVRVSRPDGEVVDVPHVKVLEAEPGKALVWGGGVAGIFRGEHRFDLQPVTGGKTMLLHTEKFSGLFIGFADLPVDVLTEGYQQMNLALKNWMEQGFRAEAPDS